MTAAEFAFGKNAVRVPQSQAQTCMSARDLKRPCMSTRDLKGEGLLIQTNHDHRGDQARMWLPLYVAVIFEPKAVRAGAVVFFGFWRLDLPYIEAHESCQHEFAASCTCRTAMSVALLHMPASI